MEGGSVICAKGKVKKGFLGVRGEISNVGQLHCVLNRDFKYSKYKLGHNKTGLDDGVIGKLPWKRGQPFIS